MRIEKMLALAALASVFAFTAAAQAEFIGGAAAGNKITGITQSGGNLNTWGMTQLPGNLTKDATSETYVRTDGWHYTEDWATDLLPTTFVLTLDTNYNLSKFYFWGYGSAGFAAKDMALSFSSDLTGAFGTATSVVNTTQSNNVVPFDISASNVRRVQIVVSSNNGAGQTSIGEFAFAGTPVPEPSTLALCGMGLAGLLAYAWRKRK